MMAGDEAYLMPRDKGASRRYTRDIVDARRNFAGLFMPFAILLIVNFVVITKGSGRMAEVSARFALDSLPGKQMSIDADLNMGIIDQDEAKRRRRTLELESD